MSKYEEWYHDYYRCNEGTFPSENVMTAKLMEADAEIADLREKCDKLAGADEHPSEEVVKLAEWVYQVSNFGRIGVPKEIREIARSILAKAEGHSGGRPMTITPKDLENDPLFLIMNNPEGVEYIRYFPNGIGGELLGAVRLGVFEIFKANALTIGKTVVELRELLAWCNA